MGVCDIACCWWCSCDVGSGGVNDDSVMVVVIVGISVGDEGGGGYDVGYWWDGGNLSKGSVADGCVSCTCSDIGILIG